MGVLLTCLASRLTPTHADENRVHEGGVAGGKGAQMVPRHGLGGSVQWAGTVL